METKTKQWADGGGSVTIQYDGQGDGNIIITSDANSLYEARSMQIVVETTDGSGIQRVVAINQAAKHRIDLSAAVVTAATQTYSGSAKTPTPTVTLNGSTVPSSGYDVSYSDNTNAGTATIIITGKGEYTGTATGIFTIAKANRTLSFTDSYMVLNTSSIGTNTATPSAGSGDGAITYSIADTTYATINSSTGAVTAKTSDGSVIVTATIAEGTNYLSASASYTLYVFATTHDYSYSGSAKNVTLPPGTYKFECWGAQGGSNGTNSTYGITAQAGGKGGYSVGQLTTAQALAIQVLVGGQGSDSAAGYNGGGSTTGTSQYSSEDTLGYSKMGGGGGATDIRLSDGALLSRMIVAGGGSGGAMCYKNTTTETTKGTYSTVEVEPRSSYNKFIVQFTDAVVGHEYKFTANKTPSGTPYTIGISYRTTPSGSAAAASYINEGDVVTIESYPGYNVYIEAYYSTSSSSSTDTVTITAKEVTTSESTSSQVGYAGGGTTGAGYSSSYYGTQNSAGSNGSFGKGANQPVRTYRYCSGAGGGGWYGGGRTSSNSTMSYCKRSGGGSGFVNTSASAGNRPSGYTGLELDNGATYDGNSSFPSTGGGTETGHSGDGYARITRLE